MPILTTRRIEDAVQRATNRAHHLVLRISGGRIGTRLGGMPTLELITIGRKSGLPRSVMLTAPVVKGETLVVVASRRGVPQECSWYLNLLVNPDVQVALQNGPKRDMTARVATPEEHDALWPRIVSAFSGYGGYQEKFGDRLPVVLLSPRN